MVLTQNTDNDPELSRDTGRCLEEIINRYTHTFLLLQQYDKETLIEPGGQKGGKLPAVDEVKRKIVVLKKNLIKRQEATELFAQEQGEGLASIFSSLKQTVFGAPAYPTVETKAAHLLYFIIKNHPFVDGNKRTAAFLFVDFLHLNQRLFTKDSQLVIGDMALAALTLLIAESKPQEKKTMVRLTINMLAQGKKEKPTQT